MQSYLKSEPNNQQRRNIKNGKSLLLLTINIFLFAVPTLVKAKEVTCSDNRTVKIVYQGAVGSPPCRVVDSKHTGHIYRAQNEIGYCENNFDTYVFTTLSNLGIKCHQKNNRSVQVDDKNIKITKYTKQIEQLEKLIFSYKKENGTLVKNISDLNSRIRSLKIQNESLEDDYQNERKKSRLPEYNEYFGLSSLDEKYRPRVVKKKSYPKPNKDSVMSDRQSDTGVARFVIPLNPERYEFVEIWLEQVINVQYEAFTYLYDQYAQRVLDDELRVVCGSRRYCYSAYYSYFIMTALKDARSE